MSRTRTIIAALEWGTAELSRAGKPSPRLDAEILLAHLLAIGRLKIYLDFERPMGDDEARAYMALVRRRAAGEPAAYITGKKEFYSREFIVTPDVLIPRPETECMVEAAIEHGTRGNGVRGTREKETGAGPAVEILDLGCGSGCIGITIAAETPSAIVTGVDISAAAIEVAKKNAQALGVADRMSFLEGDLYRPVEGRRFDLIVSNPPYVPSKMVGELQIEIQKFEPRSALNGGADGLDFVRKIVSAAPEHLNVGGTLYCEIAEFQSDAVREIAAGTGRFDEIRIGNDLSGRPRFLAAKLTPLR